MWSVCCDCLILQSSVACVCGVWQCVYKVCGVCVWGVGVGCGCDVTNSRIMSQSGLFDHNLVSGLALRGEVRQALQVDLWARSLDPSGTRLHQLAPDDSMPHGHVHCRHTTSPFLQSANGPLGAASPTPLTGSKLPAAH